MTPAAMAAMGKELADNIKSFVSRSLSPLQGRLGMLETQRESTDQLLADIEERVAKLERERLRASE